MSIFFNCVAYDDVNTTIRLKDHVIFLALKDKNKETDVHLTLNPFQVRTLAEYLSSVLEHEDHDAEDDYTLAVPF